MSVSIPPPADQGRQSGREPDHAGRFRQIERLDPQTVAPQHDPAAVALPDREGEHAVELLDEPRPPGVIGLQHHLGVAVGEELVALPFQFGAQFRVIVDAAVEYDGQAQGRIDHGLLGGIGQIDDLQPAVAERHPALSESSGAVGTAGSQHFRHSLDRTAAGGISIEPDFTADATHGFLISLAVAAAVRTAVP